MTVEWTCPRESGEELLADMVQMLEEKTGIEVT